MIKRFGPFNERITRIYLYQILKGVSYIHSQQIVHRDIKCANILTTTDAMIKISDFGAAKQLSKTVREAKFFGNKDCKSFKGSPFWLAPEIAN